MLEKVKVLGVNLMSSRLFVPITDVLLRKLFWEICNQVYHDLSLIQTRCAAIAYFFPEL